MKFECDRFGKDMNEDKKQSSENWQVFETKCKCRGKGKIKFEDYETASESSSDEK